MSQAPLSPLMFRPPERRAKSVPAVGYGVTVATARTEENPPPRSQFAISGPTDGKEHYDGGHRSDLKKPTVTSSAIYRLLIK
jgi:hypothetical protein